MQTAVHKFHNIFDITYSYEVKIIMLLSNNTNLHHILLNDLIHSK